MKTIESSDKKCSDVNMNMCIQKRSILIRMKFLNKIEKAAD